ncbi:unnamed protein product [Lepeophtheirus salmonis]|uniref:(salmon louse) hypothetical protein n=1 Tax=Lepeophtheirus salmonis TaxID=72036 RepID=A0A817FBU6_LEPSM|nr:unnamed protein product [Lepeophtheirus salmonis]CAG9477200.1 unnamed protein product [Lepeophtheirus salmonis]
MHKWKGDNYNYHIVYDKLNWVPFFAPNGIISHKINFYPCNLGKKEEEDIDEHLALVTFGSNDDDDIDYEDKEGVGPIDMNTVGIKILGRWPDDFTLLTMVKKKKK